MHVHDPKTLVERGPVRIAHCNCGAIHLHIGPVSLRLELASFWALGEAIIVAREKLTAQWATGSRPVSQESFGDA